MRERLDVADVEARTKIRAKYLRALENEEWGLLPGPTFVRTFLRTYAEAVGVDPNVLVEEYRLHHEPPDELDLQPLSAATRDRRRGRARRAPPGGRRGRPLPRAPRRVPVIGALVVALLAFLVALGLLAGGDDPDSEPSPPAATETERTTTSPARERRRQRRERAAPTGVRVRIAPLEETYVCVDRGPGTDVLFEDILVEPQTFRDPDELRVNLGRRSAAVSLNGEAVEIAESADPIALDFTTEGSTELVEGDAPCA
jgi:hypothetical protein